MSTRHCFPTIRCKAVCLKRIGTKQGWTSRSSSTAREKRKSSNAFCSTCCFCSSGLSVRCRNSTATVRKSPRFWGRCRAHSLHSEHVAFRESFPSCKSKPQAAVLRLFIFIGFACLCFLFLFLRFVCCVC